MKRVISIITFLLFLIMFSPRVFAQDLTEISSSSPTKITIASYQLAYPGILPDHPFYFLKITRDKFISLVISNNLKKAEFDLLTSDKRLNAGVYLLSKSPEKENLALSTISKGENYFEEAIVKVRKAQEQGMDTSKVLGDLFLSAKKHQDVLSSLEKKITVQNKETIKKMRERMIGFEKQVKKLRLDR